MTFWTQRILVVRHRELVDGLAALTVVDRPCYPSASGFRFVYDPGSGPSVTAASTPVQELGLAVQAMSDGDVVLAAPSAVDGDADGEPAPSGLDQAAPDQTAPDPAVRPAATAARELADQGARALAGGWFEEAAQLFFSAGRHTPTDPHLWFGAGVAASHFAPAMAADRLLRAARYYRNDDPAAAAYCIILAACLHESLDDEARARQILADGLTSFEKPCPALALHLARLGPDRDDLIDKALAVDPMLDVDLAALHLDPDPTVIERRCLQLRREISQIEAATAGLRSVDGGAGWPDPPRPPVPGVDRNRFPVAALELVLAARLATCREALDVAREDLLRRERLRRLREAEWVDSEELVRHDLDNRHALPVLAVCVVCAVAIVVVGLVSSLAMASAPAAASPIAVVGWLTVLLLTVGSGWLVLATLWTHRRYPLARQARDRLPQLRSEAAHLREDEFAVRLRFDRARAEAERRIDLITERRAAIIPRRPPAARSWRFDAQPSRVNAAGG